MSWTRAAWGTCLTGCTAVATTAPEGTEPTVLDSATAGGADSDSAAPAAAPVRTPPEVDADCWAWLVTEEYGAAQDTVLRIVDPDHLEDLHVATDFGADGKFDHVEQHDWLDGEHPTAIRTDSNGDGAWDRITTHRYDAELRTTETADDWGGDGVPDKVWTYLYTADLLTAAEVDADADGDVDEVVKYRYDGEGRLERIEGDVGGDGVLDSLTTYVYVAPGSLDHTVTVDDRNDGRVELVTTFVHDAEGRVVREVSDSGWTRYTAETTYVPGTLADRATYSATIRHDVGRRQFDDRAYTWHQEEMPATETFTDSVYTFTTTWSWTCPERGF